MSPITMIRSLTREGGGVAAGADTLGLAAQPFPRININPSKSSQLVGLLRRRISFTVSFKRFFALERYFIRFF